MEKRDRRKEAKVRKTNLENIMKDSVFRLTSSLAVFILVLIINLAAMGQESEPDSEVWRRQAVERARILSGIKWTPVADGMSAVKKKFFRKGVEYTGLPYSSVKSTGRYIGFDISVKTFLAAVQNPLSVVYTNNLKNKVPNAGCYYGTVCSSFTSYALGCGIWYYSFQHGPSSRQGVVLLKAPSAQTVREGDVVFRKSSRGGHVELITELTKNDEGKVTHVQVQDSYPPTTRNTNYTPKKFSDYIKKHNKQLYRITDLNAWRESNKADSFLFPNYKEDSTLPVINRVLLLDRGDWVPYQRGQVTKINIMDKDNQGVKKLVIKRGNEIIEEIKNPGKTVIERTFSVCGDYTAYCVMDDGGMSQACEFSICDLDFSIGGKAAVAGKPLEIKFNSSDNMKVIILHLRGHHMFVSDKDRQRGKLTIPRSLLKSKKKLYIWLIGENRYGRLKRVKNILIKTNSRSTTSLSADHKE